MWGSVYYYSYSCAREFKTNIKTMKGIRNYVYKWCQYWIKLIAKVCILN